MLPLKETIRDSFSHVCSSLLSKRGELNDLFIHMTRIRPAPASSHQEIGTFALSQGAPANRRLLYAPGSPLLPFGRARARSLALSGATFSHKLKITVLKQALSSFKMWLPNAQQASLPRPSGSMCCNQQTPGKGFACPLRPAPAARLGPNTVKH